MSFKMENSVLIYNMYDSFILCHFGRVVKAIDLRSIVLARMGSNPIGDEIFILPLYQIVCLDK